MQVYYQFIVEKESSSSHRIPKIELPYLRDQEEINLAPSFSDVLVKNSIAGIRSWQLQVTQPDIYIKLLSLVITSLSNIC